MKKSLLLFSLFFFGIGMISYAQDLTINYTEVTVSEVDITNPDIAGYAAVTNNTNVTKSYTWEREVIMMPENWQSAICDKNQCYLPWVDSAQFELTGGETGDIITHVYPDGLTSGTAVVKVIIRDDSDTSSYVCSTFTINVGEGVNTEDVVVEDVKIFPNPANDYFALTENTTIEELTIFNIIGRPIRTYKANMFQYDINDLASGLYLVRMIDKKGEIIKTVRLTKR